MWILEFLRFESEQDWNASSQNHNPCYGDENASVANRPPGDALDRIDDGQISVQGQEYQSQDGSVTSDMDDVLDDATTNIAKGP